MNRSRPVVVSTIGDVQEVKANRRGVSKCEREYVGLSSSQNRSEDRP